jgi:hypothetical protein
LHSDALVLPGGDQERGGHAVQADAEVAADVLENLPAPQLTQAPVPAPDLYLPMVHIVHVSAARVMVPVNPALHKHASTELPAGDQVSGGQLEQIEDDEEMIFENVPASHSLHAPDPLKVLYFPASHAEQGPPSLPAVPALHLQSDLLLLAASESAFEGHTIQADSEMAPDNVEYLPGPQLLQSASPAPVLNLPARH